MTLTASPLASSVSQQTHLPDWGLISAQGADARSFLHGQLSQDIVSISPDEWRLAAYCSPQGRVWATLWVWSPSADEVLLLLPRQILPSTMKRLSMFVMRAKCKFQDVSDQWQVLAHTASLGPWSAPENESRRIMPRPTGGWWLDASSAISTLQPAPSTDTDHSTCSDNMWCNRVLEIRPSTEATENETGTFCDWHWQQTAAGFVQLETATQERFVPHMLNWEKLGGIHFKKGCYPGQEVVARSEYRGVTKRRATLLAIPRSSTLNETQRNALQPTYEIYAANDATATEPLAQIMAVSAMPDSSPWSHIMLALAPLAQLNQWTDPLAQYQIRSGEADAPAESPSAIVTLQLMQQPFALAPTT